MRNILIFMLTLFMSFSVFSKTLTLTKKNSVLLSGPIYGSNTAKVMNKLLKLDNIKTDEPIYLILSSPGGSINTGLEFIELAKNLRRRVDTIVIFAASMAFIIHETLGTRYIINYGTLMAHKASGGFRGEFPGQLDSRYNFWKNRINQIDKDIVTRLNKYTLSQWKNMYENEYWINGYNAVEKGMSDKKVKDRCGRGLKRIRIETFLFWGYTFKIKWSTCPLITEPLDIKVVSPDKTTEQREALTKVVNMYNYKNWSTDEIRKINKFNYSPGE